MGVGKKKVQAALDAHETFVRTFVPGDMELALVLLVSQRGRINFVPQAVSQEYWDMIARLEITYHLVFGSPGQVYDPHHLSLLLDDQGRKRAEGIKQKEMFKLRPLMKKWEEILGKVLVLVGGGADLAKTG